MSTDHYLTALADAMGIDVAQFDVPGVSVIAGEDRRDERLISHYRVGARSVLWCDPDLVGVVADWVGHPSALALHEFRTWALDRDAAVLGSGLEHVLPASTAMPLRPAAVRVLDGTSPATIDLVRTLRAACSDDDNDEADFDLDALDRYLTGWIEDGRLLALAGGRPFAPRPGFLDVGVLVRPEARRTGRGRAVIAAVVDEVRAAGALPLYRCNVANAGSARLCRSLGFVPVVELEAFEF